MSARRLISAADIDALLHPARAFAHPQDVVCDPDMTLYEKRAILSSWASDACAVEDMPAVRRADEIGEVKFDDIMEALCALDEQLEQRAHPFRPRSRQGKPGPDHSGGVTAY